MVGSSHGAAGAGSVLPSFSLTGESLGVCAGSVWLPARNKCPLRAPGVLAVPAQAGAATPQCVQEVVIRVNSRLNEGCMSSSSLLTCPGQRGSALRPAVTTALWWALASPELQQLPRFSDLRVLPLPLFRLFSSLWLNVQQLPAQEEY